MAWASLCPSPLCPEPIQTATGSQLRIYFYLFSYPLNPGSELGIKDILKTFDFLSQPCPRLMPVVGKYLQRSQKDLVLSDWKVRETCKESLCLCLSQMRDLGELQRLFCKLRPGGSRLLERNSSVLGPISGRRTLGRGGNLNDLPA